MDDFDENISNFRFVAFDTETTGPSSFKDYIVEIAALAFDEEFDEHRRFESLIKPPCSIPSNVVAIHGITDEMVKDAPVAPEVLNQFSEFLDWVGKPRVLLAHNAGFDVGMLMGELGRAKNTLEGKMIGSFSSEVIIDTCMLAKALVSEIESHSMRSLIEYFQIQSLGQHRALNDVRMLRDIFMKLLGLASDRCLRGREFTLGLLIDLAGGYFRFAEGTGQSARPVFCLPPRIAAIEQFVIKETRVAISYENDEYRHITPLSVRIRGFRVYVDAFCHRDNIKKTFRADRILKVHPVEVMYS